MGRLLREFTRKFGIDGRPEAGPETIFVLVR